METSKAEKENSREDLFVGLLDEILSPDNMAQAWKQVRANKGAARSPFPFIVTSSIAT